MKKNILKALLISVCCLCIVCCATTTNVGGIEKSAYAGDYSSARSELESRKGTIYNSTSQVLYQLDSGLLSHYDRDYEASNKQLAQAEQLIYDNYTKSISQSISSWLTNDNVIDYPGEAYEDIYTNLFMALNYLNLGNTEDAMVEIRRFDNKQKVLSNQYQEQIAEAKGQTSDASDDGKYSNPDVQFYSSALASYLSMILYRARGNNSDVRIDYQKIQDAFANQKSLYPFPIPSSLSKELDVPKNMARINFFAFSGLAPTKIEDVLRINSYDGTFYYKLALPVMQKRGTETAFIVVTIEDAYGNVVEKTELETIESIENIAEDTFGEHLSLIYYKSLARSIAKAATGAVFDTASKLSEDDNEDLSLLFSVLSFASKVTTEVTEQADLRTSRYFPAEASVGGVTVEPGIYRVTTEYLDSNGNLIYSEITDGVQAKASSANVVETICLR